MFSTNSEMHEHSERFTGVFRAAYTDIRDRPFIVREGNNYVEADPLTDFIHWVLVFVAIPIVSILGIIGNSISLVVLYKQGFSKTSNILLFGLAISDIIFMIGVNGPPKAMYEFGGGGFQYPELTAHFLFYSYHIFDSLNWGSGIPGLFIPVLITVERLVAVFLPLRFTSIVTPLRTTTVIIISNIFSYGLQIYVRTTWFEFTYVFDVARNATVGYSTRTAGYWKRRAVNKIIELFYNSLMIFVTFVFCGCVAIGIKIKMASNKRIKMTNTKSGSHMSRREAAATRTTKMLLCLCFFYTTACAPVGMSVFFPGFIAFPVFTEEPNFRSVGVFVYHVYKLIYCINASINFVIYVAMSSSFRKTFLSLMCSIKRSDSKTSEVELSNRRSS